MLLCHSALGCVEESGIRMPHTIPSRSLIREESHMPSQVVWITGASSGIGAELARQYSQSGAKLILSARRKEQLEEVKATCQQPDEHLILPLDLGDFESHEGAVKDALSFVGHIDIMIHNAGISQRALVEETSLDVDRRIMEINFFGTVSLTKLLLPSMLERQSGQMVVVSSVAGLFGTKLRSAYCASKHALQGFFESLYMEVSDKGVDVTIISPGFIQTEISAKALKGDGSAHAKVDPAIASGMPVEVFVRQMISAIKKRKPAAVIGGGKEALGVLLKRFIPPLFRYVLKRVKVT